MTKHARVGAILDRYGRVKVLAFLALTVFALTTAMSGAIYVVTTSGNAAVAAGEVTISNSAGTGALVLNTSDLKPGDSATGHQGDVTITNNGAAARYVLSQTGLSNTGLGAALHLKIEDITGAPVTPPVVYDGNLGAFTSQSVDGDPGSGGPNDPFTSGLARTYKFSISWPNADKDGQAALQGLSVSGTFKWKATQF